MLKMVASTIAAGTLCFIALQTPANATSSDRAQNENTRIAQNENATIDMSAHRRHYRHRHRHYSRYYYPRPYYRPRPYYSYYGAPYYRRPGLYVGFGF